MQVLLQGFQQNKQPKLVHDQPEVVVLADDDEEIISWEGPKKPPQSPIICDQDIVYTKPVFRLPRRMMHGINRQTEVPKTTATARSNQSADKQQVDKESNKRQHSTIYDPVPLRTVPPSSEHVDDDDEVIMSWTGPPTEPLSPINCTGELIRIKPVFRQPRRRLQKDNSGQYRNTSGTATCSSQRSDMDRDETKGSNASNSNEQSTWADGEVQDKRTSKKQRPNMTASQKPDSSHMPPRDPLCHVPNVTPPCPIVQDQRETPLQLRTYTHVS